MVDEFGGCPVCRECVALNIGKDHYGCCHTHKKKWYIGTNLFSNWKYEEESTWETNAATLSSYEEVVGWEGRPFPK